MLQIRCVNRNEPGVLFRRIAEIHQDRIPTGFLSGLGVPAIALMYRGYAGNPHSFLLVAEDDTSLAGFLCCAVDTRCAYRQFLLHHGVKAGLLCLPKALSIRNMVHFVETLLYPRKTYEVPLPKAEILNFCVDRAFEGRGVGRRLYERMRRQLSEREVMEFKIVTGDDQRRAQDFYERAGAARVASFRLHGKAVSHVYVHRTIG